MYNFAGKVVLITGASSGIGAESALHFARLGADLVLGGRNIAALSKVADSCKDVSCRSALAVPGCLENDEDVDNLVTTAIDKYKRLDVLVNNAGILETGTIETATLEQFDKIFRVNVRSAYNLTMKAAPHLIRARGNIVNVSSICGLRSFPGVLVYGMSKACLEQFTRCVALELGPKQVRVNAVCPGVIVTPIQRRGGLDEKEYRDFLEASKESHPLGRPGEVGEVAAAITFLASDKSSFITGNCFPIDGGRHAMSPSPHI